MFRKNYLNFHSYELYPKIDVKYEDPTRIFGNTFAVMYYRDEKMMHFYAKTATVSSVLKQYFDVKEVELPLGFSYYAEVKLKKEREFYEVHEFNDLHSFISSLEPGQAVFVWVKLEPNLREVHYWKLNKVQRLAQQGSERHKQIAQQLRDKVKEPLYMIKLYLLDNDRKRLKLKAKELQAYSTLGLAFEIPLLRQSSKKISKILNTPPKLNLLYAYFNEKRWLHTTRSNLSQLVIVPNPSVVPIIIGRGSPLPDVTPFLPPDCQKIYIGKTESGKDFNLCFQHFEMHSYIIGASGAGKTTFQKHLLMRLKEAGAFVIFIDPHGEAAEELARIADYYFDAYVPNFAINPLCLPKLDDREKAKDLATQNLIQIFEKIFRLTETSTNIKHIITVLLDYLYTKTDCPTFADIYEAVQGLINEELDIDVDDPTFQRDLEILRNIVANSQQSGIGVLTRLRPFAYNKILRLMTSENKLDLDKIVAPGKIAVFKVPKGLLGEDIAFLVMATLLMSLFFYTIIKGQLHQKIPPIVVDIDEFQNVADLQTIQTILSESRKYHLHLVLAHQYTEQLNDELITAVLANTGVKFLLRTQGFDVKRLKDLDPAFKDPLEKTLPSLERGSAVILWAPLGKDEKMVPVKVYFEKPNLPEKEPQLTTGFEPRGEVKRDIKFVLTPVLKYLPLLPREPDFPKRQRVLYVLYSKGPLNQSMLATLSGLKGDQLKETVSGLIEDGCIELTEQGRAKVFRITNEDCLFMEELLRKVAPSDEGLRIAKAAMLYYLKEWYMVSPVVQTPEEYKPDLVAIELDKSTLRPKYSNSVAIEIESPNEVETHLDQVARNWTKESTKDFVEVHTWVLTVKEKQKLQQLLEQQPEEIRKKVKIFALEEIEGLGKTLTPQLTAHGPRTDQTESKTAATATNATTPSSAANVTNTNNNNGKGPEDQKTLTGELTLTNADGSTRSGGQEQAQADLVEVEIEGRKYYVRKADYAKLQQILATKNYKVVGNKIMTSVGFMKLEVSLISSKSYEYQGQSGP